MKIQLRGKRVGVEKLKKANKNENLYFVDPTTDEFFGIVRLLGDEVGADLILGSKVYFGNQSQSVRMLGTEIHVMEDSNVLAVVKDEEKPETP